MRIHSRQFIRLALVLGTTIATTLNAQGGPPRDPAPRPGAAEPGVRREIIEERVVRGGGPDGRPARPGRGNPAAMLLGLRTQLELTEEQVKRLEGLRDAPPPKSNAADMMRARADLLEATQGDANLTAARGALDRMSRLRTEQMLAGIAARQAARAVLTPTQKSKLDGMRRQVAGRARQAIRRGGMRGRGGVVGGRRSGMMGGRRGGAIGGRPGFGGPQRIIEERIIRGPGGQPGGPQGPMMNRQGGRPPIPPDAPVVPDSVR